MDTKGYGVSLMELFRLLMKKIRVIIAVVIACVIVMEIVTPRGSTYYQCTAIMIIEPEYQNHDHSDRCRGQCQLVARL